MISGQANRSATALRSHRRSVWSLDVTRFFLIACVLALGTTIACDAPSAGPTLPAGASWLSFSTVSSEGPRVVTNAILAASSTAELESGVLASETSRQPGYRLDQSCPAPCWGPLPADKAGLLYLAVATKPDGCSDTAIKERAAIAGRTLYFIHWVGARSGTRCDAAVDARWRLLSVSRRDLPGAGIMAIRLQLQGAKPAADAAESQAKLSYRCAAGDPPGPVQAGAPEARRCRPGPDRYADLRGDGRR